MNRKVANKMKYIVLHKIYARRHFPLLLLLSKYKKAYFA
jgi:hypothetical protein